MLKARSLIAVVVAIAALPAVAESGTYRTKRDEKAGKVTAGARAESAPATPNAGGTCASPTLVASTPYADTGTTVGGANTVATIPSACNGLYAQVAGPDVVYSFTTGASNSLTITVTPTAAWDTSVYVLNTCGTGTTCVAGSDSGGSAAAESISGSVFGGAGTHFLYVDSFYSTGALSAGTYSLSVTGTLPAELIEFRLE